jgi:hypothetical protein
VQRTSPLTAERLAERLVALGYHVAPDGDADLMGLWGEDRFWFMRMGSNHEILQVRGRWHRVVSPARRGEVLLALNDWYRERIWPKAYLRAEEAGVAVYAEVSVDLNEGVTDAQIDAHVRRGLAAGGNLFESLSLQMPESGTASGPV